MNALLIQKEIHWWGYRICNWTPLYPVEPCTDPAVCDLPGHLYDEPASHGMFSLA